MPGELRLLRNADAVRVHHEMLDRPPPRRVENLEKLRMNRRLAAADLHDVRLLFVAHHAIEHELHLLHRPVRLPVRPRLRVADRAGEVARIGDLHQRQATVLLVIGAKPAIVRAPVADRRVELHRQLARLQAEPRSLVVLDIGRNQDFFQPMPPAPLMHVDALILENDLRLHLAMARRADAVRQLEVEIGPVSHGDSPSGAIRKAS
jgi:hypothetical protein